MKRTLFILFLICCSHVFMCLAQTTTVTNSLIIQAKAGMTVEEFNQLLSTDKLVLAEFYADWCAPCRQLTPIIKEIADERSGDVIVIRVNKDDNRVLFSALNVYELPTLIIYRNKNIEWTGEGFFPKEMIEEELR